MSKIFQCIYYSISALYMVRRCAFITSMSIFLVQKNLVLFKMLISDRGGGTLRQRTDETDYH